MRRSYYHLPSSWQSCNAKAPLPIPSVPLASNLHRSHLQNLTFCSLVELNSSRNRMNASNLAICFAPNVLRAKGTHAVFVFVCMFTHCYFPEQSPMSALNEMQAANTLLMTMITYFDVIFLVRNLCFIENANIAFFRYDRRRSFRRHRRRFISCQRRRGATSIASLERCV